MAGKKYVSHSLVTGAGAPHDGLRCHEFDAEEEVLLAAKEAVAFQADVIDAALDGCAKAKAAGRPKPVTRSVTISNVTFAPDGSLYHATSLTYGKVPDDLLAGAASAFSARHAKVSRFQKKP